MHKWVVGRQADPGNTWLQPRVTDVVSGRKGLEIWKLKQNTWRITTVEERMRERKTGWGQEWSYGNLVETSPGSQGIVVELLIPRLEREP